MLGETYELVMPGKFQFIAEQVSHHLPISAIHIEGHSGYIKTSTFQSKTSFGLGTLSFTNIYNEQVTLAGHNEEFEFTPPPMTIHGLLFGSPYIDIEGTATLRDV